MFSVEVFGAVVVVLLVLTGTIVGIVFGVKKCRNDDGIIDYSVRKNLLGLQMNNFRGRDSFDYDAI